MTTVIPQEGYAQPARPKQFEVCNQGCGHKFKKDHYGRVDLKDVVAHKAACRVSDAVLFRKHDHVIKRIEANRQKRVLTDLESNVTLDVHSTNTEVHVDQV